jgi:segregation and condensation protein A
LPKDVFHQVELDKITVREKMTLLLDKLRAEGRVVFEELFDQAKTRMDVVVMFLAMLELVKVRAIRIFQEQVTGPIVIEAAAGMEQAAEVAIAEEEQHGT